MSEYLTVLFIVMVAGAVIILPASVLLGRDFMRLPPRWYEGGCE